MNRRIVSGIMLTLLLLVPIWHIMLVSSIVTSETEEIDVTTNFEGRALGLAFGPFKVPIRIEEHVYAKEVKGDNIVLRVDMVMMNMADPDKPEMLDEFSYNSTYVINKDTLENVMDAPEADKPRVGYEPLYPQNLKAGEDIPNVWLDRLNTTGTLEFRETTVEQGITLHKYFVNRTITKEMYLPEFEQYRNITLTSTKTILIQPLLGGLPVYTENEAFVMYLGWEEEQYFLKLVDLEYNSTAESRAQRLEDAKKALRALSDVNGDGIVNIIDGVIIGVAFGTRPGDPKWNPIADIVPDNFINIQDVVLWAIHFGETW